MPEPNVIIDYLSEVSFTKELNEFLGNSGTLLILDFLLAVYSVACALSRDCEFILLKAVALSLTILTKF